MRVHWQRLGSRLRSYWQQLGTATQLLIVLDALALLLIGGMLLFTNRVIVHSVQAALDSDLNHHLKTVRAILQREGHYFTAEGQTVLSLVRLSSPSEEVPITSLTTLLKAIQDSHDMHGSYIFTPDEDMLVRVGVMLPPAQAVLNHPLFVQARKGLPASQLTAIDNRLWWLNVTPFTDSAGNVRTIIVFARRVDDAYLTALRENVGPEIVLSNGEHTVTSFGSRLPECCVVLQLMDYLQRNNVPARFDITVNNVPYRVIAEPLDPDLAPGIIVALLQPKTTTNLIIRHTNFLLFIIAVLLIIVTFGLVHFLVYRIFRPIERLKRAAERMGTGQLDHPIQADGTVEVRVLATTLDRMRQRLQELVNAQRMWNEQLEAEVQTRTRALQDLCQQRDRLLHKLISAQEEERRRIGRELHDDTSQTLAHLIITTEMIARTTKDPNTRQQLYQIKELTTKVLDDIRRIILDLRPRLLDEYGLAAAIHHYAQERLSPAGVTFHMETRGQERRLPYYAEINLFRIAQEAINNIVRHAQATHVEILLSWEPNQVLLRITDNGRGFDVQAVLSDPQGEHGLGLLGMQERASLFRGVLSIRSAPGKGTVIQVCIPTLEEEFAYVQNPSPTGG